MGGQQSVQYARFIPGTNKTPGFSDELVNINCKDENDLCEFPYDDVKTIWDGFQRSVRKFPNNDFLGTRNDKKEGRPYEWKTWTQVDNIVQNLARGYQALNLTPEIDSEGKLWKFMGIYAKNREEWVMTDLASMANKGTSVAFYDTLGPETVEFVINQTELTTISCSANYLDALIEKKAKNPKLSLQNLVSFDEITQATSVKAQKVGINLYTFQQVQETGKKLKNYKQQKIEPQDIVMLCYTSGTTGVPKSAMLSHLNFVSAATSTNVIIDCEDGDPEQCVVSYLPLAHSFEKVLFVMTIIKAIRIGYYSGDPLKLVEDMQILKPTYFPSVPRLFNRMYDIINQKVKENSESRQWLVRKGIETKLNYLEQYGTVHHTFYDKLIFNKMTKMLGGKVKVMVTGSAPISPDVINFLKVCFCAPICEGYGQTESSAASCATFQNDNKAGHVGGPLTSVKIKLKDIQEMNYLHTDPEPRGEICFKGPAVFVGYFKNQEKTKEALTEDGWLLSGDVGKVHENGSIKIIDRAKNIFKLAQGEYIAPEKLENAYIMNQYVEQVFVHGDSLQSYLVAIAVVDKKEVMNWASENGMDCSDAQKVVEDPKIAKMIKDDFNKIAASNKFSGLEKIKQVHLTLDPFTIESDLLTPTMKIKRAVAEKRFANEIEKLYSLPLK